MFEELSKTFDKIPIGKKIAQPDKIQKKPSEIRQPLSAIKRQQHRTNCGLTSKASITSKTSVTTTKHSVKAGAVPTKNIPTLPKALVKQDLVSLNTEMKTMVNRFKINLKAEKMRLLKN